MPLIDDIRENNKKMKGKSFKEKLQYFWEYYKLPTIVIVFALILVISLIKTAINNRDVAFEAVMVNCIDTPDPVQFEEILGIDQKKEAVVYDNSFSMLADPASYNESFYTSAQKLVAVVAAAQVDVMISDKELSESYFNSEFFADLRNYFTEEELLKMNEPYEDENGNLTEPNKVIWHQMINEETGEPIGEYMPIAIDIGDAPAITSVPCCYYEHVYFTVFVNTQHPEDIRKFYDHLYSYDTERAFNEGY